ncbi:MAG: hypothetical protein NC221_04585, partial [Duncaniella sp.]|nr:hypothetical protein [Duncaniella sp.]
GLLHWCLRPARLPIPPSGRFRHFDGAKVEIFFHISKRYTDFLAKFFWKIAKNVTTTSLLLYSYALKVCKAQVIVVLR